MRHATVLAALSIGVLACGDDGPSPIPEAATVRDSAGIRVVDIDTAAVTTRWVVSSEPTWSFEEVQIEGESHPLLQLFDITPLPDGRILFGEYSSKSLLIGDPLTREFRRIGRGGDGPEEFGGPVSLEVDDTGWITVVDRERLRVVRVDTAGNFGEARNLGSFRFASAATAVVGPDLLVKTQSPLNTTEEGIHRPESAIVRLGPDGAVDTLGSVLDEEYAVGPGFAGLVLLGAIGFASSSEMGLWIGFSDQAEVTRWSPRGPDLVVRWTREPARDNEAHAAEVRAALIENVPPNGREQMRATVGMFPISEGVGQFSELAPVIGGGVWIGPWSPTQFIDPRIEAGTWLAVGPDGMPRARVDLPDGFSPSRIGDGFVLGILVDDFGVEHVQRREIEG